MNLSLLFGRWQDKSIDKVIDFEDPGVYLLKAKTFGIKGFLGGTHSWMVHVDSDGNFLVAEVTDLETLKIQGATMIEAIRKPRDDRDQLVFISNREAGQRWFGAEPTGVFLGTLTKTNFRTFISSYPLASTHFHVLRANCNTFSSWICHCLCLEPIKIKIGIGATRWDLRNK